MALSPEVKNAIILIIAVSIALKFITPTLLGDSTSSYLYSHPYQSKPAQRDIADISYSGHLKDTALAYDYPFPGRFPESFEADQSPNMYPPQPTNFELCNLCTCFTGNYKERTGNPINQYAGAKSEEECKSICQASSMNFIGLSDEKVTCDYSVTR